MADRPRERSAGVTVAPGASPGKSIALLALAVSLACVALLVLFGRPALEAPAPEPPPLAPEPAPLAAAAAESQPPPAPERAPEPAEPPALAAPSAPPAEEATPEAPVEGEDAATVPSGIGLFPPPGSDPLKLGIVVPDDFELPEGFLRHYQVTDDGQELEPILLFHPDYELLDDAGQPIPLPADRVVPPELAPPGLPIRQVEVPPPRDE
jgi:hypothetical protein